MNLRIYLSILSFACVVCLGGCGRNNDKQFIGKWTFDREYTLAHMPKDLAKAPVDFDWKDSSAKGSPSEAASIAANVHGMMDNTIKPMLSQELVGQMSGQTFSITPKVMTDSSGTTRTYNVVERPTPNEMTIKLSDGELWTLTTEDGRITIPTTGGVHFNMYFKRIGG